MAKITPIDIIKGVSSKFGGGNAKIASLRTSAATASTWLRESIPSRRMFKIQNIGCEFASNGK